MYKWLSSNEHVSNKNAGGHDVLIVRSEKNLGEDNELTQPMAKLETFGGLHI